MTPVELGPIAGNAHRLKVPQILAPALGDTRAMIDVPSLSFSGSTVVRECNLLPTTGARARIPIVAFGQSIGIVRQSIVPGT
jgi:hypothetical protein